MTEFFFPRLAANNIRNNGKFHYPYILSIIGTVAAFYIFYTLANAELPERSRYDYLSVFMGIGLIVAGIFSVIFLFYTNSFLIKRRRKELGLYNVLGMDKRNLAVMLGFEQLYTAVVGIGLGIITGILLQKLVTMLIFRVMDFSGVFGFYISGKAIIATVILFGAIILLTYLNDLRCIRLQKPVELLHGGDVGEKEPKTKWLLAVFGILCLGSGYSIAVFTKEPIDALLIYFLAVILVIIGTYCLFTAGSIAILKLLRRNKKFYYKTSNFITVSGMLYRMKRNAVGLANICILSCMVLVMISATFSLYAGTEKTVSRHCPADIVADVRYLPGEDTFNAEGMTALITSAAENKGLAVLSPRSYKYFSYAAFTENGAVVASNAADGMSVSDAAMYCIISLDGYLAAGGVTDVTSLSDNEILYVKTEEETLSLEFHPETDGDAVVKHDFSVKGSIPSGFLLPEYASNIVPVRYIVVSDETAVAKLYNAQKYTYGDNASSMHWSLLFDTDGTADEQIEFTIGADSGELGYSQEAGSWTMMNVNGRASELREYFALNSGFFFLGIFLGILFIMATVLIIYYKQVSEGYEDRERFQIMQKVGLPKDEIKRSVNRQVLTIFFLPLVVAAVHTAFDFPIMAVMLRLFQLNDTLLTLLCTGITMLLFLVIYAGIYLLTSRVYYKIVK